MMTDFILCGVVGVSCISLHNTGFVLCFSFACVTNLLIKS